MLRPVWITTLSLAAVSYFLRIHVSGVSTTALATDGGTAVCGLGVTPVGVGPYEPNCGPALQGVQNMMNLLAILATLFTVVAVVTFFLDLSSRRRERTQQRPGFPVRP